MNWSDFAASLAGALIGAFAAFATAIMSLRTAAADARAESRSAERTSLEALLLEMAVVREIADVGSLTRLPTQMLQASMAGIHHMGSGKADLLQYTAAVYRYNGRAERIVAFGAAKRADGRTPGVEKVGDEHRLPVLRSMALAGQAVERQLASPRLSPGRPAAPTTR